MREAGPLPLAPRPMPGEALLSWVARIAARYDLSLSELIACLRGGVGVHSAWIAELDWQEDIELEGLLTRATCLDRSEIRAARLITEPLTNPAVWRRSALAWCPGCVSDDVARHGESFERAAWQLGCYVACPSHHLFLARACAVCGCRCCYFRPLAGRQRLVCEFCRGAIDARTPAPVSTWFPGARIGDERIGWYGAVYSPDLAQLALAMQADLLRALGGSTPPLAERCGLSVGSFIAMVTDLAGMILLPTRSTQGVMSTPSGQIFATMEVQAVFELLGLVAALIENTLTACTRARPALTGRMPDGHSVPIDMAWLTHRLADDELASLRGRATKWGLRIARAVQDAISREESERRRRAAIRERERLDAEWLRQASKRYRAEAVKRIQARAERCAARRHSKHSSGTYGKRPARTAPTLQQIPDGRRRRRSICGGSPSVPPRSAPLDETGPDGPVDQCLHRTGDPGATAGRAESGIFFEVPGHLRQGRRPVACGGDAAFAGLAAVVAQVAHHGVECGPALRPALRLPMGGRAEQAGLREALGHETTNAAHQAVAGKAAGRRRERLVHRAGDLLPACRRPQPLDSGQPGVEARQQRRQARAPLPRHQATPGLGVACLQTGVAELPAACLCDRKPGLGALGDQIPFEFRNGSNHLDNEPAGGIGGVDRIGERAKMHARALQPVEHGKQMRERARQPVDAHHDQRIAAAEATE